MPDCWGTRPVSGMAGERGKLGSGREQKKYRGHLQFAGSYRGREEEA